MLTREHLDALPGRDALAASLRRAACRPGRCRRRCGGPGAGSPPAASRARSTRSLHVRDPGRRPSGCCSTRPRSTPPGCTTLDAWVPDLEGRLLAYQLSSGGDEHSVLHVLDVATGRGRRAADRPLPLLRRRVAARRRRSSSSSGWSPRTRRRPASRRSTAGSGGTGSARPPTHDELIDGPGLYDEHTYYGVHVSRDGAGWSSPATSARPAGTACGSPTWPRRSTAAHARCSPRPTTCSATPGWTATACSTCTPPTARRAGGSPSPTRAHPVREHWRELVAEDPDSVLQAVRRLEPRPDRTATAARAGPRPARGRRAGPARRRRRHPPRHRPAARHRVAHRLLGGRPGHARRGGPALAGLDRPRHPAAGAPLRPRTPARRCWRTAAPGAVDVPAGAHRAARVHLGRRHHGPHVRPLTARRARPAARPSSPATAASASAASPPTPPPRWPGSRAGGSYALVSLRGGGEEGEEWHLAGNRGQQAERLRRPPRRRRRRWSTRATPPPDQLAIMGGSNGGLLVGAALTQRPTLYRAVVCSAPLLDMVRYEEFSLGRTWNDEYGTAADPEELGWLLSYSPYHHVAAGYRRTRRCCSPCSTPTPGSTRCTPARCAPRCSTPPPATRAPARS